MIKDIDTVVAFVACLTKDVHQEFREIRKRLVKLEQEAKALRQTIHKIQSKEWTE